MLSSLIALINIITTNCVFYVKGECGLSIKDIQAQFEAENGNDDYGKRNLVLEVAESGRKFDIIDNEQKNQGDSDKGKVREGDKTGPDTPSFYDFDDTICKIVDDRILCGYNKNIGDPSSNFEIIDLGDGCKLNKDVIECNYNSGTYYGRQGTPALARTPKAREGDVSYIDDTTVPIFDTKNTTILFASTSNNLSKNAITSSLIHKTDTQIKNTNTTNYKEVDTLTKNNDIVINKENKTKNITTFKIRIRKNVSCDVKSFISKLMAALKSSGLKSAPNTLTTSNTIFRSINNENHHQEKETINTFNPATSNATYTISIKQLRQFILERSKTKTTDIKPQTSSTNKHSAHSTTPRCLTCNNRNTESLTNAPNIFKILRDVTNQPILAVTAENNNKKVEKSSTNALNIFKILRDVTDRPISAVTVCVDKQDYIYCYDKKNI